MYSAEVLSQLRTLNWLSQEARRLSQGSNERQIILGQIESLRARLPLSMLRHHDERTKMNLPSIANLAGSVCGYCRAELPAGTLHALVHPGKFGVCPNCGVFLWAREDEANLAAEAAEGAHGGGGVRAPRRPSASRVAGRPASASADGESLGTLHAEAAEHATSERKTTEARLDA